MIFLKRKNLRSEIKIEKKENKKGLNLNKNGQPISKVKRLALINN